MKSAYFDTCYLLKLQYPESGSEGVCALAGRLDRILCSLHGRAEFVSACHRKMREGAGARAHLRAVMTQVQADTDAGALVWLPLTPAVISRVEAFFTEAPPSVVLRAADALHLASAAEQGQAEIFSSDRHLLAAAHHFGLRGVNVIPSVT